MLVTQLQHGNGVPQAHRCTCQISNCQIHTRAVYSHIQQSCQILNETAMKYQANLQLLASVILVHMVHLNSSLSFTQDRTFDRDYTLQTTTHLKSSNA